MGSSLKSSPVKTVTKTTGRVRRIITGGLALFMGFEMLYVALNIAIWTGFAMESLLFVILGLLLIFAGFLTIRGKKETDERKEMRQMQAKTRVRHATEEAPFSFSGEHHEHIVPTGISIDRQMEQLRVLYEAGLYTKEEFDIEKRKILSRERSKV